MRKQAESLLRSLVFIAPFSALWAFAEYYYSFWLGHMPLLVSTKTLAFIQLDVFMGVAEIGFAVLVVAVLVGNWRFWLKC